MSKRREAQIAGLFGLVLLKRMGLVLIKELARLDPKGTLQIS